ncbi:hypothetical protein SAMN05444320_106339 [Streptoalloteichus hindustanus]|uniref:Antitoxin FitA-like ribbon-helix-helix domain-containing protein n=1 Tax=Streptoalloteichus hindustanus TaxID=2017 RepID=A0A1M5H042_STRHI|nr:hypothetical protein SAMN05444320_106339 [Streptoalloteichus hindustanus]
MVLTVRDFDQGLKAELRVRLAEHGRSPEAETPAVLTSVPPTSIRGEGMRSRIRRGFGDVGDCQLDLPERTEAARGAELP